MKVGAAKKEIIAFVKGVGMLGYGMYFNVMKNIATPLYCRAFTFKNNKQNFVVVAICEIAFITDSTNKAYSQN